MFRGEAVRYANILVVISLLLLPLQTMAASPDCTNAYASPNVLWPPNHKFSSITIEGMDDASIVIQCIAQDEPLNTTGDGNTQYDSQGVGTATAELRAERIGGGNGRAYHIDFLATNADGQCAGVVQVGVPPSKKKAVTDDGPLYISADEETLCATQAVNLPPIIGSTPIALANVNKSYQYTVEASDANNDPMTYALMTAPDGMSIDLITGLIQWQPTTAQVGEHPVDIIVADDKGGSTVQTFTLVITQQANHDPIVLSEPVIQAAIGLPYSYTVVAEDLDADPLNVSLLTAPVGMAIDSAGLISWIPVAGQEGDHSVNILVDDSQGGSASQEYIVAVPINNANPLISSEPIPQAVLGEPYHYSVIATDADGDTLSYNLMQAPAGMAIDTMTGAINWVSMTDQEGDHLVEVLVEDDLGGSTSQLYTLSVIIPNNNPVISSSGIESALIGLAYVYNVIATDLDNDPLTYALAAAPSAMAIDSDTGEISWLPQTQHIDSHNIIVLVTDGRDGSASQAYSVTVFQPNRSPQISSEAIVDAHEGQSYQYPVIAFDPDGDPIVYSLIDSPQDMTIDPLSGVIDWTPDFQSAGDQNVTILVADSNGYTTQQSFTLVIANTNRPPSINSQPGTTGSQNQTYRYYVKASDLDNDALSYDLTTAPASMTIDAATGNVNWLADAAYTQSVDQANTQCQLAPPDIGIFDPVIKWHWNLSNLRVLSVPLVAPLFDTNLDGAINADDDAMVIFASFSGNVDGAAAVLRVVDGSTGEEVWNLKNGAYQGAYIRSEASSHNAVADIDNDGIPEIMMYQRDGGVMVINNDGSVKWKSTLPGRVNNYNYGAIAIADIDNDGEAEILARNTVFNHDGTVQWSTSLAVANNVSALAVDLDLDGSLEVLLGQYALDTDGQLLWQGSTDGYSAFANLDNDANPEIVIVGSGQIFVYEHDGTLKWTFDVPGVTYHGGAPLIADLDGDGLVEIGVNTTDLYYVFNHDGTILWTTFNDDPSRGTGSTAFDFDGDGNIEVIFGDEKKLRIHDGETGAMIVELDNISSTASEYFVVADIDGDDHAEMLVVSNSGTTTGIRAIDSASNSWAPTRKIWNQYSYHIDNINNDLSIPIIQEKSWQTHNSFRQNSVPSLGSLNLPDLRAGDIVFDQPASLLSVTISNIGLAAITTTAEVNFYNGDPAQGGTLLGSSQISTLASNEQTNVEITVDPQTITNDIIVQVNALQAIEECQYQNNHSQAALVSVKVQDPHGLGDNQTYLLNVHNANETPQITSEIPTNIAVTRHLYEYQLSAQDTDRGDALHYSLQGAPEGASINPISGLLRWQPQPGLAGTVQFTVVVTDLTGASTEQVLSLTVEDHPPVVISSTPPSYIFWDEPFSYQVQVQYPEAPGLSFEVDAQNSAISIDSNGLLTWPTPWSYGAGSRIPITITVSDDYGNETLYGGEAIQNFTLTTKATNEPPVISSDAYSYVKTEQTYYYLIEASDPEGQSLSYSLGPNSPPTMSVDGAGILSWNATLLDVGWLNVDLIVSDASGKQQSQEIDLLVTEPGPWARRLCPVGIDMHAPPVGGG